MEHGPLLNFIMKDVGEGTEFWVSGYANPNLRHSPKTNVKPTKVTMTRNPKERPHRVGVYNSDRNCEYFLAKDAKGKIMSANADVYVYDTEEEAITGYNNGLELIINSYNLRIMKVLGNKIAN